MAAIRVGAKIISDHILETVAYLHGAVDPDTGHLTCHHYPIGITLIEASGVTAPALSIGECIYLIPAPWNSGLKSEASPASISVIDRDVARIGDAEVESSSLALVLSVLKDERASVSIGTLRVSIAGKGELSSILVTFKPESGEEWSALVTPCKRVSKKSEDLYV